MDQGLALPGMAQHLASMNAVNFDDLRVREFVTPERLANQTYMGTSADILNVKEIMKVRFLTAEFRSRPPLMVLLQQLATLSSGEHGHKGKAFSISFVNMLPKLEMTDLGSETQNLLTRLEENQRVIKPQWWAEWEKSTTVSNS
jgi:hypothetical protein